MRPSGLRFAQAIELEVSGGTQKHVVTWLGEGRPEADEEEPRILIQPHGSALCVQRGRAPFTLAALAVTKAASG